jgi:predicted NBD/HSP70 family sugar kinase
LQTEDWKGNMIFDVKPQIVPPLDEGFRPGVLQNHAFLEAAESSGSPVPLVLAIEQADGTRSVYETKALPAEHPKAQVNLEYAERVAKTLLWQRGGHKFYVGGPDDIGEHIEQVYSPEGARAFDVDLWANVYEKPFEVVVTTADKVPPAKEAAVPLGRHLDGCRIGFDLGASDRKFSAVVDGEAIFSEEVQWDPRNQADPRYHYHEIMSGLHLAAAHMPRVDAIGGSSAGIVINNRVRVASLFRGVPKEIFDDRVGPLFLDIKKAWGVPVEVINDGEVTALAGSMSLNVTAILGIALGSSEAGGYVNRDGNVTRWPDELAFVPVDFRPNGPLDEWSRDAGCGVQYFSQQAVFRLAPAARIEIDQSLSPADQLQSVHDLLAKGDERARLIFETIGVYLGYGVAYYADYYDLSHVLILGRVTSGEAGTIIVERCREVLKAEFPKLASAVSVNLPDEKARRVGQSVAAASLPAIA